MKHNGFVVIDYGMGNLRSVMNAFAFLGCDVAISDKPEAILGAEALVLPGVGAFGEAMTNLRQRGLVDAIRKAVIDSATPMLGICLGMQLVAEQSDERGVHEGLGLIPGRVTRLPVPAHLPLPHVGWNPVSIEREQPFFSGLEQEQSFYFVHSYHLKTDDRYVAARCDYGTNFVAAVQHENLFATQFHPERSQTNGLRLLRNFVNFVQAAAPAV